MKAGNIITLTTDYGCSDYFVGALKGAILAINPSACMVDISHDIPVFQARAGGAILADAIEAFPVGTIHVAVVDPGVGSSRRAIAARTDRHFFVGPDNGLFTEIFDSEPPIQLVELDKPRYFRATVSPTFHGRDVFAPAAAWVSRGEEIAQMGSRLEGWIRLSGVEPVQESDGRVVSRVIHIDRFGNLLLNLKTGWMKQRGLSEIETVILGEHRMVARAEYFTAGPARGGDPFFYFGSAGRLEIALREDSAARRLGALVDQPVIVHFRR